MPKSKRARPVFLHGPKKKTREDKASLIQNVRDALDKYQYVFVLEVKNMRNTYLKDVRREFSDSRIFFGKTTLLRVAMGQDESLSQAPGLHHLTAHLRSTNNAQTCLLLTSRPPSDILSFLRTFHPLDYARAGTKATRPFKIPSGQVFAPATTDDDEDGGEEMVAVAATREPELRKLGVPTRLVKGKVMCEIEDGDGYEVCRVGQVLDSRQTALLKFFGEKMSVFRIGVRAYWSSKTSAVEVVDGGNDSEVGMEVDEDAIED